MIQSVERPIKCHEISIGYKILAPGFDRLALEASGRFWPERQSFIA
jgi:hypothetical protein